MSAPNDSAREPTRTTAKTLFAAAVVGAAGLFFCSLGEDPQPAAGPIAAGATAPAGAPPVGAASATTAAPTVRVSPDEQAPVEPWLAHPFLLELEVLVVDPTGLPIQGRVPHLAPNGVARNGAPTATGADGRTIVAWRSRQPAGEVVVADDRGTLHRVGLQHGRRTLLALGGAPPGGSSFVLYRSTDAAVGDPPPAGKPPILDTLPVVATFFQERVAGAPPMQPGLHPHAVFLDPCGLAPQAEDLATESLTLRGDAARSFSFTVLPEDAFDVTAVTLPPEASGVVGTVHGEDGTPCSGVPVALLGSGPQPLQRTSCDELGRFRFEGLTEGAFTVRAGGGPEGLATAAVAVTRGLSPAILQLRRDACIRGRVENHTGVPIANARIVWRATDGSWCDATESGADGSFVVANVPAVPGTLTVWTGDDLLPRVAAKDVLADAGPLRLRCDPLLGSTLLVEPLLPEGCENAPIEVRVWQMDTGVGATVPTPEAGKAWRLGPLPAGWYQVEMRAPGSGSVDAGRHWLDGTSECDLGRVSLPQSGRARFSVPPAALPVSADEQAFEVCQIRTDADVRVDLTPFPLDRDVHLPAGDYVFSHRHRDGTVRRRRFAVRGGQIAVVEASL